MDRPSSFTCIGQRPPSLPREIHRRKLPCQHYSSQCAEPHLPRRAEGPTTSQPGAKRRMSDALGNPPTPREPRKRRHNRVTIKMSPPIALANAPDCHSAQSRITIFGPQNPICENLRNLRFPKLTARSAVLTFQREWSPSGQPSAPAAPKSPRPHSSSVSATKAPQTPSSANGQSRQRAAVHSLSARE